MSDIKELIIDNINVWTSAIEPRKTTGRGSSKKIKLTGIHKLRNLIVELALQGKLVEQNSQDVPASKLLKEIQEKRKDLVEKKLLKKQIVKVSYELDKKPFSIPSSWIWSSIGELSEITPKNNIDGDSDVSFISMPLISKNYNGEHGQEVKKWKEVKKGFTHFANGDIGLAKITPCFENSKAAIFNGLVNGIGSGTTELHVARLLSKKINPRFILLFLKSPLFLFTGELKMTGSAGQKRVPKDFFTTFSLPLPPSEEQNRIVTKIDELMVLCDQLEQKTEENIDAHKLLVEELLSILTSSKNAKIFSQNWTGIAEHFDLLFTTEHSIEQLNQTILQLAVMGKLVPQDSNDEPTLKLLERIASEKELLVKEKIIKKHKALAPISNDEKVFEVPNGWEWARIFNASLFTEYGTSIKAIDGVEGVPVLKMGDIQSGKVLHGGQKVVPSTIKDLPNLYLKYGDVLYNRTNSAELVGKTGMFEGENDSYTFASYLIRIRCHFECVIPKYLTLSMNAPLFRKTQIDPCIKQQCGQANVNGTMMKNMVITIPPLAEQYRIVAKTEELVAICEQLKSGITDSKTTQVQLAQAVVEQALN